MANWWKVVWRKVKIARSLWQNLKSTLTLKLHFIYIYIYIYVYVYIYIYIYIYRQCNQRNQIYLLLQIIQGHAFAIIVI